MCVDVPVSSAKWIHTLNSYNLGLFQGDGCLYWQWSPSLGEDLGALWQGISRLQVVRMWSKLGGGVGMSFGRHRSLTLRPFALCGGAAVVRPEWGSPKFRTTHSRGPRHLGLRALFITACSLPVLLKQFPLNMAQVRLAGDEGGAGIIGSEESKRDMGSKGVTSGILSIFSKEAKTHWWSNYHYMFLYVSEK